VGRLGAAEDEKVGGCLYLVLLPVRAPFHGVGMAFLGRVDEVHQKVWEYNREAEGLKEQVSVEG